MQPLIAVPATLALVYRAYSHKSLTPIGIIVAALTAIIHALHPWSVFFALLVVFFLAGTAVTKVKHDIKARLTVASSGASGGEGPRTAIQVLANSGVASVLILLHLWQLRTGGVGMFGTGGSAECWAYGRDSLVVGIVSNYAAVAADTFSSELGILSSTPPRLLTSFNLRKVPPGTNGGVTTAGTAAGFLGALLIAVTSVVLLPFCPLSSFDGTGWGAREKIVWVGAMTLWGGCGSLLDSLLGGWLQASVVDTRTGKVIEGEGGRRVLVQADRRRDPKSAEKVGSRKVESGRSLLDNNGVNILMAALMSLGGMGISAVVWDNSIRHT